MLRVIERGNAKEEWLNYFPRSSFDVLQGCANSRPGRLGIPELMQMDGLGFSLCAAPPDIVRSCISKWHGSEPQQGEQRSVVFQTGERQRDLVSKRIVLSQYLN